MVDATTLIFILTYTAYKLSSFKAQNGLCVGVFEYFALVLN